jgi:myo-inositol catabolism protein IolS
MQYRRLGRTGLNVSVIGVGTWQYGGEWGRAFTQGEVDAVLGRARDLGINLIDTAECYGDHVSEALIGQSIARDRQYWIVATKFGHKFHHNFERTSHYGAEEVRAQLDASLRALRTDYIDLYQFHSGSNAAFDNPELWEMLAGQVQAGKIRAVGLSISPNDNLYQTERASAVGAGAIQVVYNRLDREPEAAVLPGCQVHDLGVLARVPLASGFLTGKYAPGATFTNPDDIRATRDAEDTQRRLAEAAEIQQHEVPPGVPMAAWALAWCLQHPAVTCVIPGCKSVTQVESNAAAADLLPQA